MRLVFVSALFSSGVLALLACDQTCDDGSSPQQVQNAELGSSQYVCVPDDATPQPGPASTDAPVDSGAGVVPLFGEGGATRDATAPGDATSPTAQDAASDAPSNCATLGVASDDVLVVTKGDEPPILSSPAPDGVYALAQASFYPGDGGGTVFSSLRASLQISGANLMLGAGVTAPVTETNESFTIVLVGATLEMVCASEPGAVAPMLPPPGLTEDAYLAWDAVGRIVTLRLHAQTGDLDLVFAAP